jgi:hypothetical protein
MKLEKLENKLKDLKYPEHVINGFKAILGTIPFTGGIASLISDYIPSQRQLRLEEFVESVANDLITFKDSVNENYIQTDEFAFMFEKCFKGAVENYQKEKIVAFKAVLINSLIDFETTQTEKEYYLTLVDNLSLLHIQVLTFMASPHEYLKFKGLDESVVSGGFRDFFPKIIPNVDIDIIKLSFKDLFNYGFLNIESSIFNTMTSSSGWSLLSDRVTPNGRKFIAFISLND